MPFFFSLSEPGGRVIGSSYPILTIGTHSQKRSSASNSLFRAEGKVALPQFHGRWQERMTQFEMNGTSL